MSRRNALTALAVLLLATAPVCLAADKLQSALQRRLLADKTGFNEVSAYCQSRILPAPQPATAAGWQRDAELTRHRVLDEIIFRGRAKQWREADVRVEWLDSIAGGPGYRIRKLRYECLPGFWIPALLYEPERLSGRVPVSLNFNGHDSNGLVVPYKQINCVNQARRGMLALSIEFIGMGQLGGGNSHYYLNQIDLCGASGVAPFYLAMRRGLDLLLEHPHADAHRVAADGLSGGGWQTILISSLDPRVTLANPVAGYSRFLDRAKYASDLGDAEQNPTDLGRVADYTLLTMLRAPRPTLLTYNNKEDCCFGAEWALPPLREAALPVYRLLDKENNLRWHVNESPGTHNFERDNREAFYRMLGDFFFAGDATFDAREIPCDGEVKTAGELRVPLPEPNENLHSLALGLSEDLPAVAWALPADAQAARKRLGELVHFAHFDLEAEEVDRQTLDDVSVRFWRLRLGATWTVPAVEFEPPSAKGVTVLAGDDGRTSLTSEVGRHLAAGQRVIALDPFDFGESSSGRNFVYALLVAALGDRPLGLSAAQLSAVAGWARRRADDVPPTLAASGRRMSVIAAVAAALDPQIGHLEITQPFGSFKQAIRENLGGHQAPELFCFGLLEAFEFEHIVRLVAPRDVTVLRPDKQVRDALAHLSGEFAQDGGRFRIDPPEPGR